VSNEPLFDSDKYLILMQQKFNTGSELGYAANINFYGKIIYLDENMTHFVYDDVAYKINYLYTRIGMQTMMSIPRSGRRGPVNVDYREHHYNAFDGIHNYEFIIVQTNDVNIYLHDKFELQYVSFRGMRFDMVFEDEASF